MNERQQPQLKTLAREECLELLQRAVVGRIGYVVDGVAISVPVNFTVLDEHRLLYGQGEHAELVEPPQSLVFSGRREQARGA